MGCETLNYSNTLNENDAQGPVSTKQRQVQSNKPQNNSNNIHIDPIKQSYNRKKHKSDGKMDTV